jgi:hypothetical protein
MTLFDFTQLNCLQRMWENTKKVLPVTTNQPGRNQESYSNEHLHDFLLFKMKLLSMSKIAE